nr:MULTISPECIES: cyclase family protein [Moorena]
MNFTVTSLDLEHGDIATDTTLHFSVHTGTHVDAPMHFIPGKVWNSYLWMF